MYNLDIHDIERLQNCADNKGVPIDVYISDLINDHLSTVEYTETRRKNDIQFWKRMYDDPDCRRFIVEPQLRKEAMMDAFIRKYNVIPSKTTHQNSKVQA